MSTILPKGIVVNSPQIGDDIQRVDVNRLGMEDITKMWKVYTTTTRRLYDPTARRLENFWWRIWGSQRRELQAVTIAGIFATISSEKSFVPLRAPGKRYEGSSSSAGETEGNSQPSALNPSARPPNQSREASSSTVQKAAMIVPHPILKKTRGPSASGPRPTARFISPHDSGDEIEQESAQYKHQNVFVTSTSPTGADLNRQKATTSALTKKKPTAFVASTSAKKRRPVMTRRQSSSPSQSYVGGRIPEASTVSAAPRFQSPGLAMAEELGGDEANMPQGNEDRSSTLQGSLSSDSTEHEASAGSQASYSEQPARAMGENSTDEPKSFQVTDPSGKQSLPTFRASTAADMEAFEVQNRLLKQLDLSIGNTGLNTETKPTIQLQADEWSDVPRGSRRSKSDGSLATERLLPDRNQAKSRASLAPSLASATGHVRVGDAMSNRSPEEAVATIQDVEIGRTELGLSKCKGPQDCSSLPRLGSFSRTSIPATISEEPGVYRATDVINTKQPEEPKRLTKSQSQLALLLEKDNARGFESWKHGSKKGKR